MSNFSLINNLSSSSAQSKLSGTTNKLNQTLQRLSSGLRINRSGDDAAGLAIANGYRSDVSVLSQGVRNANDGLSALQILDGGLNTISGLLDRASSLAAQAASGTFTGNRDTLQSELSKVTAEITRQAQNIGLASTPGEGSRFNKAVSVFIGGGIDASGSTNTVSVDLSGTSNRVDAAGLGLSALNIGATSIPTSVTGFTAAASVGLNSTTAGTSATKVTTAAATSKVSGVAFSGDAAAGTEAIAANETVTFTGADGSNFTVNLLAGDSGADIADAINNAAGNNFVAASYDATTKQLSVTADVAGTPQDFSVVSNRSAGDAKQTGLNGKAVDYTAADVANNIPESSTTATGNALSGPATIVADEQLTFSGADGKIFSVNLAGGKTGAEIVNLINGEATNNFVKASFDATTGKLSLEANTDNGQSPQSFSVSSNRAANDPKQTGLNGTSVSYTAANTIAADETLTFHVGGSDFKVELARGDSADDIIAKINNSTDNKFGIVAGKDVNGNLKVSSNLTDPNSASFTVTSNRTAGVSSSGLNNISSAYSRAAITADENLTFTVGGNDIQVALKSGDTTDDVVSKINAAVGNYGISASVGTGSNAALNTISLSVDINSPNADSVSVVSDRANAAGSTGLDGAAVTVNSASGGEAGATAALAAIKAAVGLLGQVQGSVGAGQNNLSQAIDLASAQITNFQAAESAIRDADIAAEASNLARLNTLQQAGVSALAQANQSSQALLTLLR